MQEKEERKKKERTNLWLLSNLRKRKKKSLERESKVGYCQIHGSHFLKIFMIVPLSNVDT